MTLTLFGSKGLLLKEDWRYPNVLKRFHVLLSAYKLLQVYFSPTNNFTVTPVESCCNESTDAATYPLAASMDGSCCAYCRQPSAELKWACKLKFCIKTGVVSIGCTNNV